MAYRIFTSESVTEGHPDRSAIRSLTRCWTQFFLRTDRQESPVRRPPTTGMVMVMGEISTSCYADIPSVVRRRSRI
jgi:S-adenosylmethionine synthetase